MVRAYSEEPRGTLGWRCGGWDLSGLSSIIENAEVCPEGPLSTVPAEQCRPAVVLRPLRSQHIFFFFSLQKDRITGSPSLEPQGEDRPGTLKAECTKVSASSWLGQ